MKISFLTSVMNRTHHLKKTYIENIKTCVSYKGENDIEFVLLNYNSKDDLCDFVKCNDFDLYDIDFKYIHNKTAKYFDMSHTKNILGKYASGDVLCWLDADNFICDNFVGFIHQHFLKNTNTILSVEYSKKTKGMCGRIVISKNNFLKIGGYDQEMKGWGYEEMDFTKRATLAGLYKANIPLKYLDKLDHTQEERLRCYDPKYLTYLDSGHSHFNMLLKSNFDNFKLSSKNINENKIIANQNINWGLL
tara:strand:+ start:2425 stop:3168 length:744 start_codon:yes stop_codon:yes gene_type:complete